MFPALLLAALAFVAVAYVSNRVAANGAPGPGAPPAPEAPPEEAAAPVQPPISLYQPFSGAPYQGPAGTIAPGDLVPIIAAEADGWHDIGDVLAIIAIESAFKPDAFRAEPRLNDASYGLMQTLYSTARDMGYTGPAEGLFDPAESIRYGMRYMRWCWDFLGSRMGRDPTYTEWIGSYNAGPGNILRGNVPRGYVARWERARAAVS